MRLLIFMLLFALIVPAASAAKCRKGERFVAGNTPLLTGPGLGYESKELLKRGCYQVLKSTEDGKFALLKIDPKKNTVGWVASGLVDASLSESKRAKPQKLEGDATRFVLRETPLRKTPRFDARVVVLINGGVKVQATGKSPDGLWLYVVFKPPKGKSTKGWIPRYQLSESAIKPGDIPNAGGENWSVKEAERKKRQLPSPVAKDEDKILPPSAPVRLGRTMEAYTGLRFSRWEERYRSDALATGDNADFFYKYDIQSLGAGWLGSFAYRGDKPVSFEAELGTDLWRFTAALPGGQPGAVNVLSVDAAARLATPLLRTREVDLEAGLGVSTWNLFITDLKEANGDPSGAFTSLTYFDAGPFVAINARLSDGKLGLVSLRMSLPVGGLLLHNDPTTPEKVPPEDVTALHTDEPGQPDPDLEGDALSLALGVDAQLHYTYFVTESVGLDLGFNTRARQSTLDGPGKRRQNIYLSASNLDLSFGIALGARFLF